MPAKILLFSKGFNTENITKEKLLLNQSGSTLTPLPFEAFWFVKCEIDAVPPGADCLGQKCPEKSFLGGNTWFCICTRNCSACLGTDCGDKK